MIMVMTIFTFIFSVPRQLHTRLTSSNREFYLTFSTILVLKDTCKYKCNIVSKSIFTWNVLSFLKRFSINSTNKTRCICRFNSMLPYFGSYYYRLKFIISRLYSTRTVSKWKYELFSKTSKRKHKLLSKFLRRKTLMVMSHNEKRNHSQY